MPTSGAGKPPRNTLGSVHLSLAGLLTFTLSLVATVALLTYWLVSAHPRGASGGSHTSQPLEESSQESDSPPTTIPPWGELITKDIELGQPEEYLAFELATNRPLTWTFEGATPEQARVLMLSSGLTPEQAERALAPAVMKAAGGNTVIQPDDELVFALTPAARGKLYGELGRWGSNRYMQYPYCFPGKSFDSRFGASKVPQPVISMVRQLLYRRGGVDCFSDFETVMRRVPTEAGRMELLKVMSRESAVLARLRIRPDTDIDKLIGYWDRGMQVKDVRPLLESLKQSEGGGSISLIYLLPPFARQRLYTSQMAGRPGDAAMDCHWSTMNFFNATPDNRFADPAFTAPYLETNYYRVAKPCAYGDVIVLLDAQNKGIHSAVYLADDLVFTKNGNNLGHPWMLMRIKDLMSMYATEVPPQMVVYRNRSW